jgi:catechol 2,3-dioxygenase-like lactoylglutathione lyase family enzyme
VPTPHAGGGESRAGACVDILRRLGRTLDVTLDWSYLMGTGQTASLGSEDASKTAVDPRGDGKRHCLREAKRKGAYGMPTAKLRHVAISTEDPEKTAAWYQDIFGLVEVGRSPTGGIYLSDGDINFAVLRIRSKEDPSKIERGVSHFGFVVEDAQATYRKLDQLGARRLPDVALGNQYFEVKYLGPDDVTVDVGEHGWVGAKGLEPASEGPARAKIRHVAISTDDTAQTAAWYQEVFGLTEAGLSPAGVYLTDGDTNFAVLRIPLKGKPGQFERGMSHFGFVVEDAQATYRKLDQLGTERLPDIPLGNQYFETKYVGPDGVTVDVGEHGWVGAKGIIPAGTAATAHSTP